MEDHVLFVVTSLALAQDIAVLRHADIADGRPAELEEGFVRSYVTAAGFTLDVGDHLTLGTPLGSSSSLTMVGGGGAVSGVGVGVARGSAVQNGYFQTVYNGTQSATMAKAVLLGLSGNVDPSLYMAPRSLAGSEVVVVQMKLAGTRKRPFVWVECRFVDEADRKNASGLVTVGDIDDALRLGEVVSAELITREVAIAKLKEAKELLDLGVYTQAQFDAEREKYLPYVTPAPAPAPAPAP